MIFALGILFFHISKRFVDDSIIPIGNTDFNFFSRGYIGVEFFFIVSGYLLASSAYTKNSKGEPVHGDLQLSNVITSGGEDLWIDLGDFGYGYPMLDLGMLYFLTRLTTEERGQQLFHLGLKELSRIWDIFAEEYAGAYTPAEKEAFEQEARRYAALHMIYLGVNMGFIPGMLDDARRILL